MGWRAWLSNKADRIEFKNVLIAFDTSTLLKLYKLPVGTTETYLKILEKLRSPELANQSVSVKIPPQVVFEFVTLFAKAKSDALEVYDGVLSKLSSVHSILEDAPDYVSGQMKPEWRDASTKFAAPFIAKLEKQRKEIKDRNTKDPVFKFLESLFDETKRCEPTDEELQWITLNGAERYRMVVPPGFEDQSKSSSGEDDPASYYIYSAERKMYRMFGDLLVWRQLLDCATSVKQTQKALSRIILVTDDEKPDWFKGRAEKGHQHPLLTVEAMKAGFHLNIINSDQFLRYASKGLSINLQETDLEAVRLVSIEQPPQILSQKEVQLSSQGIEVGLVSILLRRPTTMAMATQAFELGLGSKPQLSVDFEIAPKKAIKCSAGVRADGNFNIHIYGAEQGQLVPPGKYVVRYRAESSAATATKTAT